MTTLLDTSITTLICLAIVITIIAVGITLFFSNRKPLLPVITATPILLGLLSFMETSNPLFLYIGITYGITATITVTVLAAINDKENGPRL